MNDLQRIDGILPYLEIFDQQDYSFGDIQLGKLPYYSLSAVSIQFRSDLHNYKWIKPFNWIEWSEEAKEYINQPSLIKNADVGTIQKLFTTNVRADRFTEGHLASMFENGHITELLRRLKTIKEKEFS